MNNVQVAESKDYVKKDNIDCYQSICESTFNSNDRKYVVKKSG